MFVGTVFKTTNQMKTVSTNTQALTYRTVTHTQMQTTHPVFCRFKSEKTREETLQRIYSEIENGIQVARDIGLDISLLVAKPHEDGPPDFQGNHGTNQAIQLGYDGL